MINIKLNLDGNENGITEIEKYVNKNECYDTGKSKRKKYNKKYQKRYRIENKDSLKDYHKKYRTKNKEFLRGTSRDYYHSHKRRVYLKNVKNRDYRNAYSKKYYRINKSEIISAACKRFKNRYKTDILFKIKHLLRIRIGDLCKGRGFIKSQRTLKLLGCDLKQFKIYLEHLFKPGMTWDNHSQRGWHIDHIVPLISAKNQQELEELCHYKNLQPLWWYDNLSKGGNTLINN